MVLGIQLYGPVAKGTLSTKDLMEGLKEIGFGMAEPCISLDGKSGAPTFWQPDELEDKFEILNSAGLKCISCHISAANYAESIPSMCELADKYGVKQFVVGTGGLSKEEIESTATVYCMMADALKDHGAEVLLHNGKPDIAAKIDGKTAYEYMIECCGGKVSMQFDTGWAARGGEEPKDIIDRNQGCIKSLHFKDFNMNVDTDVDTCIGDGTLDNEMYMNFGREKGIPLFIDADTYDDVLADARKSYEYLVGIG